MATTCPSNFDVTKLRERVSSVYTRVARDPGGDFHFHRGAEYAIRLLGYDPTELEGVPERAKARFAGVGNPLAIGPIAPGETVLDHACGAGMDLLLAARRSGPAGKAIGVDATPAMTECAAASAREARLESRVEIRDGSFEELPVDDASIDVVISNGVLNLAPDKRRVLREVFRVLRPGGRLYLADVVVQRELSLAARSNPELWAACVGGALPEPELTTLSADAGLLEGRIHARFRSFADTSAETKVSRDLEIGAVNFFARKPF
ncbi:MAG TPA: methyltransferase domain-containing protein [Polyangiaceae bacterium]|jgi:SAM-dependent methyltransferase|nr:methyltransferase domain-containing protein [Polyangiaceae bacterium]